MVLVMQLHPSQLQVSTPGFLHPHIWCFSVNTNDYWLAVALIICLRAHFILKTTSCILFIRRNWAIKHDLWPTECLSEQARLSFSSPVGQPTCSPVLTCHIFPSFRPRTRPGTWWRRVRSPTCCRSLTGRSRRSPSARLIPWPLYLGPTTGNVFTPPFTEPPEICL